MSADPVQLAAVAASRGGVFTADQARAAGFSQRQTAYRVQTGEWVRLRRGVYCTAEALATGTPVDRGLIRLVAAVLACPRAVVSHHSAGRLYEWAHVTPWDARPRLTIDRGGTSRTPVTDSTLVIESAGLPDEHVGEWRGLPITSRARTAVDLARHVPVKDGLVVVDHALHLGDVTQEDLAAVLAYCDNWPGVRRARKVVGLADGRSESPYESVARLHAHRAGIVVEPQPWIYDQRGCIGRSDLRLVGHNAVLEIDGAVKYDAQAPASTLLKEKRRHERIEQAGVAVGRLSTAEADDPDVLARCAMVTCARAAVMTEAADGGRHGWFGPPPPWFEERAG